MNIDIYSSICDCITKGDLNEASSLTVSNRIDKDLASQIFLFLYDYTNSFKNANTTPEVLRFAWRLLTFWINHDRLIVGRTRKTLQELKFCQKIISKLEKSNDWEIIWAFLNKDFSSAFKGNINKVISNFTANLLSTVTWLKIGYIVIESWDSTYLVYLCSKYDNNLVSQKKKDLNIDESNIAHWFNDIDEILGMICDI